MRQGDILIRKIDKIPESAKKSENKTVALGEATGHHHTFNGQVQIFREPKISMCKTGQYAEIENAVLEHQEHRHLEIKKQVVEIRNQRELSLLSEVQKVMD
ncbi:MAG: hypothetical protein AABY22_22995 [Nanoarchaeota archaeon]